MGIKIAWNKLKTKVDNKGKKIEKSLGIAQVPNFSYTDKMTDVNFIVHEYKKYEKRLDGAKNSKELKDQISKFHSTVCDYVKSESNLLKKYFYLNIEKMENFLKTKTARIMLGKFNEAKSSFENVIKEIYKDFNALDSILFYFRYNNLINSNAELYSPVLESYNEIKSDMQKKYSKLKGSFSKFNFDKDINDKIEIFRTSNDFWDLKESLLQYEKKIEDLITDEQKQEQKQEQEQEQVIAQLIKKEDEKKANLTLKWEKIKEQKAKRKKSTRNDQAKGTKPEEKPEEKPEQKPTQPKQAAAQKSALPIPVAKQPEEKPVRVQKPTQMGKFDKPTMEKLEDERQREFKKEIDEKQKLAQQKSAQKNADPVEFPDFTTLYEKSTDESSDFADFNNVFQEPTDESFVKFDTTPVNVKRHVTELEKKTPQKVNDQAKGTKPVQPPHTQPKQDAVKKRVADIEDKEAKNKKSQAEEKKATANRNTEKSKIKAAQEKGQQTVERVAEKLGNLFKTNKKDPKMIK